MDSLIAIYNNTTGNTHKHITSTHPSLHHAHKHQLLKPKQLISILISAFANANNIRAFIESGNDTVIKCVHVLIAQLVVNHKASLSLATDVDLNEVIQATLYLKLKLYVPMTPNKINRALISMFSKFTVCVNGLIVKARTMNMPADYDELPDKYTDSSSGWLVINHDGWDSVIKQFFDVSMYSINLKLWIRYKLVFDLVVPNGHGAQTCNNTTMVVLKHYAIHRSNIILSINDTNNAFVIIGRLIADANDTCNMQLANLAYNHTIEKQKRTLNKRIVNLFEECKDMRLAMRQMIRYIWNKKAKSRKINYEKCNKQINYNVTKVGVNNNTRISCYACMYQ